jgi:hypothetical protein
LGSDTATVTFSSIPGTYTDLILVTTGVLDSASTGAAVVQAQFNSDTGTNYSWTRLRGNGSSATSDRFSASFDYHPVGLLPANGATTIKPGVCVAHIMSYANTNVFKTTLAASGAATLVERDVCLWRSTSAITSISLTGSGLNFKSGSTFSLFGVKAA